MANKQGKMVCWCLIAVFQVIHANCRVAKSGTDEQPKCELRQLTANQINYRMRVTMNDARQMTGQMLAFDKVSSLSFTPCIYVR